MNHMLEGYLAFARGDAGENAAITDVSDLLDEVVEERRMVGGEVTARSQVTRGFGCGRRLQRCVENLVANAARHAATVEVGGRHAEGHLTVTVDDDGPGIPPNEREAVFKPSTGSTTPAT